MNVIQIENLWKEYRLGVIGHGTLTQDLQSWWARMRGKEDPNSKIVPMLKGQKKQIEGNRFWALQDINLEIKEGEILGIIGKNGAGKSTLLKILSRVTAPSQGNVKVKGRIASLLEVGTGFHPELTGRENVYLNGAILGMTKQEVINKFDEIVDFSGIEPFIDTPVKRYSSGMYVRLAFAVAAHLEPEILIIDEVLAVGDAEFQKKCLGKMGEVSREGRTVLFVSHSMSAIEKLCSKIVLLQHGTVKKIGDPFEIIDDYLVALNSDNEHKKTVTGTGEATLISIAILDEYKRLIDTVKVGQSIKLRVEIQVHTFLDRLVFGYGIKDTLGQVIFGTNTDLKQQVLYKINAGERYRFDISFPANIGPGNYTIQTALTSTDTHLVNNYEWRDVAFVFNVFNSDKHPFVGCAWIDPNIEIVRI